MARAVRCENSRTGAVLAAVMMAAGLSVASCGSDPDMALTGRIDGVMLARQRPTALIDQIVGGFDIYLDLGDDAPAAIDVKPGDGNFTLVRQSDEKALAVLRVECLTTRHIEPGDEASVHLTVAQEGVAQSLPTTVMDEICRSGSLRIDGVIADSLAGEPNTAVNSPSFALLNCPPP
jgi:hypothetical protein